MSRLSRLSRSLISSTLLLAALSTSAFAQSGRGRGGVGGGAFGGGFGGGFAGQHWAGGVVFGENADNYTRLVVVSNSHVLPSAVQQIIAAELVHRLRNSDDQDELKRVRSIEIHQPMGVPFDRDALRLSDDSVIQALTILVDMPEGRGDQELSEEEQEKDRAAFDKLWERSRQELDTAFRNAHKRIVDQFIKEYQRKLGNIVERQKDARQEFDEVIRAIEAADQQGSPEELREQFESSRRTLRELALNRVSIDARREAIVARIDELRKAGVEASADDPLIAELEKIVDVRERQLQHVRDLYAAGQISSDALSAAETEMAKARVELLKAKRAAMADAAGGVMQELNNELSLLIVQLAEMDARAKALEATVSQLRETTSVRATTATETDRRRLSTLRRRLEELDDAKARLENNSPTVAEEITITPLDEALSLSGDDEAPERE
jgi:hypothetical protein